MSDIKYLLGRLRLTQAELARILGVDPDCVNDWITTKSEPLDPVADLLRYLDDSEPRLLSDRLRLLRAESAQLDDGIYSLTYTNAQEGICSTGILTAILRSGSILGSDRRGGVFTGSYRYLPERDLTQFQVSMVVPPDEETIFGLAATTGGRNFIITADFDRPDPVATSVVSVAGHQIALQLTYLGPMPN